MAAPMLEITPVVRTSLHEKEMSGQKRFRSDHMRIFTRKEKFVLSSEIVILNSRPNKEKATMLLRRFSRTMI